MTWRNVHDVIRKKMQNHIYNRMTPLLYRHKTVSVKILYQRTYVTGVARATTVKHMCALRLKKKLVTDSEIITLLGKNVTLCLISRRLWLLNNLGEFPHLMYYLLF